MKTYIKLLYLSIFCLLFINPSLVMSQETFNGKLDGWLCTISGTPCPVDSNDPQLRLEPDIVLKLSDSLYLHLTNLPRWIKMRYYNYDVRILGFRNPIYRQILVDRFQIEKDGKFVTLWDAKEELRRWEEEQRSRHGP